MIDPLNVAGSVAAAIHTMLLAYDRSYVNTIGPLLATVGQIDPGVVSAVQTAMGVGPGDKVDVTHPDIAMALTKALALAEGGTPAPSDDDILAGLRVWGVHTPTRATITRPIRRDP